MNEQGSAESQEPQQPVLKNITQWTTFPCHQKCAFIQTIVSCSTWRSLFGGWFCSAFLTSRLFTEKGATQLEQGWENRLFLIRSQENWVLFPAMKITCSESSWATRWNDSWAAEMGIFSDELSTCSSYWLSPKLWILSIYQCNVLAVVLLIFKGNKVLHNTDVRGMTIKQLYSKSL